MMLAYAFIMFYCVNVAETQLFSAIPKVKVRDTNIQYILQCCNFQWELLITFVVRVWFVACA